MLDLNLSAASFSGAGQHDSIVSGIDEAVPDSSAPAEVDLNAVGVHARIVSMVTPSITTLSKKIWTAHIGADIIHLVMDNLNTHRRKSLTDAFGTEMDSEIWSRFTIHYTPA
ncbi:MAG: hypothetical protein ACRD4Q_06365, partial [Candidatus Acidiferrales bacterium]